MPVTPRDIRSDQSAYVPPQDSPVQGARTDAVRAVDAPDTRPVDTQAPTVQADAPTRTKVAKRGGLLRTLIAAAAVAGAVIAATIGGAFLKDNVQPTELTPVAPIEAPLPTAPGQLPDANAPPGQQGEVDTPVRGPTLPGAVNGGTTEPQVFSPWQIRVPDQVQAPNR